jgi:hypothetical protein
MQHTFVPRSLQWALPWCTVCITALACGGPSGSQVASNSPLPSDSIELPGSRPPTLDSLLPTDSLPTPDSLPPIAQSYSGIPFGPFNLWRATTIQSGEGPAPYTASINYSDSSVIVAQIDTLRARGQRGMLMMTDDRRAPYMTDGKFDLAKWKSRMARYDTPEIKRAVAWAVADGTLIGNTVIDEPRHRTWGGSIDKALVDQMCAYAKSIFPTLPVGPIVVHWWLESERYRVCDFTVVQYDWAQPPHGWGTPGGRGDVISWRDAALAQAKKDGTEIAFSMNVLGGGAEVAGCPLSSTGGHYKPYDKQHCRMTPDQVRKFGLALGPAGCAMFMWKFDSAFMSKSANIRAMEDVAAKLAESPLRSCKRPS